jgi:transcriptional regulator with XRE-family HTH domain
LYDRFRQILQERSITVYRVAKDTGISQVTLSDWKTGRSVPKVDKLQKIANYLGVTIEYLLTGKGVLINETTSIQTKETSTD